MAVTAADAPAEKRSPVYPDQPSSSQQENALKALSKARKEVAEFVYLFGDSGFRVYPTDRQGFTAIVLESKARDRIMLRFEARFASNFTELSDARFVSLTILFDQLIFKEYTKQSELDAFIDSPDAFIEGARKKLTPADLPEVVEVRKVK